MNTYATSKEAILEESRKLVMKEGVSAINMRTVAKACKVAVGSIYNYFPSKADLLGAVVEEVWKDIFYMPDETFAFHSFTDCVSWLFESIKKGCVKYPGFITLHSMSFAAGEKESGREMMTRYFGHMKQKLCDVLKKDTAVRQDAFQNGLTEDTFVDFVFTAVTAMLMQEEKDCLSLLEIVRRCIY